MARQRLYIDESGDHSIKGVKPSQWDKLYLCLFGCQLDEDYCRRTFAPNLVEFKIRHFGDEFDDPVILHREEIAAKTRPFHVLRDSQKNSSFCAELLRLIDEAQFTAFAVVIDKMTASSKWYGLADSHPYHIGLLAMLERYCGKLNFSHNTGDVMAESRGGREDNLLKAAYRAIFDGGSSYRNAEFFQRTLSSKELRIKPKAANISGLQLADLLAYPAKMRALEEEGRHRATSGFTKDMADVLDKKYNRRFVNGQVNGYGKIFLA